MVIGYSAILKEGILGNVNAKSSKTALGKMLDRANDQLQTDQ